MNGKQYVSDPGHAVSRYPVYTKNIADPQLSNAILAKQLLTDAFLTVTAVAEACGFCSVYHFCRVFKERAGMTPTQYARHNKASRI